MGQTIKSAARQAVLAAEFLTKEHSLAFMESAAQEIIACFKRGGKLLIAGNGGSLCDAMHFAEELTGQFRAPRKALPAIALADPSHMSCVSNDLGFESIFSRNIEAYGKKEDILIILSTSGNSKNLIKALSIAKEKEMKTIAFLGKSGGALKGNCNMEWIVEGFNFSDRIQEAHMAAIHIIIERIEELI